MKARILSSETSFRRPITPPKTPPKKQRPEI
jgi:hypothetical protein